MSLVHEALQKAEREKQRKLGTAPSPPISHATPQPAPAVHQPVAAAPVPAVLHAATTPAVERPAERRGFLLPALVSFCGLAAIVAIFLLVMAGLRQPREQTSVPATPGAAAPTTKAAVAATPQPAVPQPTAAAAPANVPPPAAPVADESKYKLSGIMKDPDGKPVAVLNGRVAYEGYYIDGATVKKIETDRAVLDVKGQELVLRLF